MRDVMNKTMDRADLLSEEAAQFVQGLNGLVATLYAKHLYTTSWSGLLPTTLRYPVSFNRRGPRNLMKRLLGRGVREEEALAKLDAANRGAQYEPLPDSVDDRRFPWYLYWEIYWVMKNGPVVGSGSRLLDAGGTSSLFSCYLASLGCEVHSIDLDPVLTSNANKIARAMGWNMHSYTMNMRSLAFPDCYFDHAYSICVFEHLEHDIKQAALAEIARCLKPNGILSITFDYRNPAPLLAGAGADTSDRNQLKNTDDIRRCFLSNANLELLGNGEFCDEGRDYLAHPQFGNRPYTFGAIFLRRKA
ncbi:MAG: class I SAM-dependent methyltransferase [Chloroflexi bacterium]|nr:class I SAM-dependent methyltransferase [Chloroflexota bacterium]